MLKINLLPPSINAAKQRNIAIGVVAALIAAEIGIFVVARTGPAKQNEDLNARKTEAEAQLAELQTVGTESTTVLAKESGLAPKYDFITNLIKYNKAYPGLYRRTAGYTFREVMFLNLAATSNQLTFDAYVSNPTDVSRLMLGLSNNPDIIPLPTITGVPGWDEAEQSKRAADQAAQLQQENLPGVGTGIIGGAGGDMPGGYPGMGGGYPGGMPGGYPGGMPGGGYPGGMTGGGYPGGMGSGMPGMSGGYPGGMMGGGGYPGGGSGGSGDLSRLKMEAARLKPKGFTINVTCLLKEAITRPSYGSSDQQAGAAGGGGGGMGGYPGGGGMPGGYPGGGMPGGSNGP